MRILIVEDDPMIGQSVSENLSDAAYAVDWVQNGREALEAPFAAEYDCCLLDLGLPLVDGIKVLEHWRRNKLKTPVIILTARDELPDRVLGLDKGADDYVVKPFEMAELLARIRAVNRRRSSSAEADGTIPYGDLTLHPLNHEVHVRSPEGERVIILTGREFALFEALMARPGAVLSRENLEHRIYGWDEEIDSNAIEYIIYTLRRKIGMEYIKNIRGVGWKVNKVDSCPDTNAAAGATSSHSAGDSNAAQSAVSTNQESASANGTSSGHVHHNLHYPKSGLFDD